MRDLRGKKTFLTGAASGIGRALATQLAREGAHLFLVDVDTEGLAEVAAAARQFGVEVITHDCDLQDPMRTDSAIRHAIEGWDRIELLVNNAGVAFYGPTETMTAQQWDWLLQINLLAPIRITRQLLPVLLEQPDAHIVNMCSISGLVAGGRFAAYHVSKFGLVGYTQALRAEYGRRGLGVTAICPGPSVTNLYKTAISGRPDRKVPVPPRWVCTTPEKIAAKTIKAIRRNRRMVLVTPLAHTLFNANRFCPWLLDMLNTASSKRLLGRSKRSTEQRGAADLPRRAA